MMLYYTYSEPQYTTPAPQTFTPQWRSVVDDSRRRYLDMLAERQRAEQIYFAALAHERRLQHERAIRDAYLMSFGATALEEVFEIGDRSPYLGRRSSFHPHPQPQVQVQQPTVVFTPTPIPVRRARSDGFADARLRRRDSVVSVVIPGDDRHFRQRSDVNITPSVSVRLASMPPHASVSIPIRGPSEFASTIPLVVPSRLQPIQSTSQDTPVKEVHFLFTTNPLGSQPQLIRPSLSTPPSKDAVASPSEPVPVSKSDPSSSLSPSGADLQRSPALFVHPRIAAILRSRLCAQRDRRSAFKEIEEIQEQLKGVIAVFADSLFGTSLSAPVKQEKDKKEFVHCLDQLLARLDAVKSSEEEGVRERRREVVRSVQVALEMVEGGLTWERQSESVSAGISVTSVDNGKGKNKEVDLSVDQDAPGTSTTSSETSTFIYDAMFPVPDTMKTPEVEGSTDASAEHEHEQVNSHQVATGPPTQHTDVVDTVAAAGDREDVTTSQETVVPGNSEDIAESNDGVPFIAPDEQVADEWNAPEFTHSWSRQPALDEVQRLLTIMTPELDGEAVTDEVQLGAYEEHVTVTIDEVRENSDGVEGQYEGLITVEGAISPKGEPSPSTSESSENLDAQIPNPTSIIMDADVPVDTLLLPNSSEPEMSLSHIACAAQSASHSDSDAHSESDQELVVVEATGGGNDSLKVGEGSDWSDLDDRF